jgi:tRNA G18 (ribose-2'-O)-methylase SpoU
VRIALHPRAERPLAEVATDVVPLVLCLGAEREGLPEELVRAAERVARIPLRSDGPESLNVAMAATVALYEVANRMAGHA